MVNKFGDNSNVDILSNLQLIKKIEAKHGLVKEFIDELLASISLGFTPCFHFYYKKQKEILPVYVGKERNSDRRRVYIEKNNFQKSDISDQKQSDKTYLVYWKQSTSDDADSSIAGLIGERGGKGDPGPRGKRGSPGDVVGDMCEWIPSIMLKDGVNTKSMFNFYFKEDSDYIKKDGVISTWLDHSIHKNNAIQIKKALCIKDVKPVPSTVYKCMPLEKSVYYIADVETQLPIGYFCLTIVFTVEATTRKEIFLLSNFTPQAVTFRAISFLINEKTLRVYGAHKRDEKKKYVDVNLVVDLRKWYCLQVEWADSECTISINGTSLGSFITIETVFSEQGLSVGAKSNDPYEESNSFKGSIAALVGFYDEVEEQSLNKKLKNLLVTSMMQRYKISNKNPSINKKRKIENHESPPAKKRKIESIDDEHAQARSIHN